jgi:hypothetical protein
MIEKYFEYQPTINLGSMPGPKKLLLQDIALRKNVTLSIRTSQSMNFTKDKKRGRRGTAGSKLYCLTYYPKNFAQVPNKAPLLNSHPTLTSTNHLSDKNSSSLSD